MRYSVPFIVTAPGSVQMNVSAIWADNIYMGFVQCHRKNVSASGRRIEGTPINDKFFPTIPLNYAEIV